MSSASPERTRKPSWSASQWYIDIGSPGPRTKRVTPTCASSSPTRSATEPREPRSHHFISRTLRTNQLTPGTLCAETVEHDRQVAPPLPLRRGRQGGTHEDPDVLRLHVAPHRAGALSTSDDAPRELLELGRAGLLPAVDNAPVQSRSAHVQLRDPVDEVEERLAGIVRGERLLSDRPQLGDVALDHREHEVVLGRETAEDRPVADPGAPRDLVDTGVGARRGELLGCRVEHPLEISPRVDAELGHQAALASAGSVSTSASIRATCRLRRSATKTTRLRPTRTAAPAKA